MELSRRRTTNEEVNQTNRLRTHNHSDQRWKCHLQGGHHLTFLLAIEKTVVVLHADEGSEVVADCVVCQELTL